MTEALPIINPSYKVIADHLRSSAFLIADGVLPSNEGRGYVLRRIMRRAMRHVHKLGAKDLVMYKLVPTLIAEMGAAYPELKIARDIIIETLKNEEEKFRATLDRGIELLNQELEKVKKGDKFSGQVAFKLYDTYGFPLDLTQDILKEKYLEVDLDEFNAEMEIQKKRAKENWVGSGETKDNDLYFHLKEKLGLTKFVGYETTESKSKILAILKSQREVQVVANGDQDIELILDQTTFYATSGGQKGDDGNVIPLSDYQDGKPLSYERVSNIIDIAETRKFAGGLFSHFVSEVRGQFKVGDEVITLVNNRTRQFRSQNHSATHLLHFVLKRVLGNQVTQKGSNVDSTYFTFDFNHNQPLTRLELDKVEDLVNFYIRQNTLVKTEILPIEAARNKGAVALFGEKYDTEVRVLSMAELGKKDLSIEFCGGTHVRATGNIGLFKIISEKGVASGVRRIEAKTGFFAFEYMRLQERKLEALLEAMKLKQQFDDLRIMPNEFHGAKKGFDDVAYFSNELDENNIKSETEVLAAKEVIDKIFALGESKVNEIKTKEKEIEKLKKEKLAGDNNFASEPIAGINFIHHCFNDLDAKELRDLVNQLRVKKEYQTSSLMVFFGLVGDKISVLVAISPDLTSRFDATKLVAIITSKLGGSGGGGKIDFAMGGGNNKTGIEAALQELKAKIKNN